MKKKTDDDLLLTRSLDADFYYSDIEMNDVLYAVLVRSPATSGKIKSLTIDNLPKGYYLFSAQDIPGKKYFEINKTIIKTFAFDNVSYTGEPVGILCGPDENVVRELLEEVNINFDIQNLESALKNVMNSQKKSSEQTSSSSELNSFVSQLNDMPSLDTVLDKNHIEQNIQEIVASREIKTGAYKTLTLDKAEKKIFKDIPYFSKQTWCLKQNAPNWEETNGSFCFYDGTSIHAYTPTRWVYSAMNAISDTLSLDKKYINIHKTKVSSIYSKGLHLTTQITTQVAVAAYLTKKPVKLIFTQEEQDLYLAPGVETIFTYKAGLTKDGIINAMDINIDIDIGVLNPFAQEITDRLTIAACNYYSFPNLYIKTICHTSKNPPTSVNIKNIDSQAFFAIENQMQTLSELSQLFPIEIREKNLDQQKSNFPFQLDNTKKLEAFSLAIKISDFNRKYASFHMDAINRKEKNKDRNQFFALPLRGIGISSGYNVSEYYGQSSFTNDSKVSVTLQNDNRIVVHAIKPSQVVQDMWKTDISHILQIDKDNIFIDSNFSYDEIPSSPEDTFSSIGITNELIKKCCLEIQKKRFHEPLPISSKKGISTSAKKVWNKEKFCGNPFGISSFATTVVELELDSYTYSEKIKGIWMTIDCGEIFDEAAALRTIRLEIQQELELLVEGKTIPCDNIKIEFIKSEDKSAQIGGLVHNTLPAAFTNALSLALATQLTQLPCTENQLYELIKEQELKK